MKSEPLPYVLEMTEEEARALMSLLYVVGSDERIDGIYEALRYAIEGDDTRRPADCGAGQDGQMIAIAHAAWSPRV